MTKSRTTKEWDAELVEVRAKMATAGKTADQHDKDHFDYLDRDPVDLDAAERSAAKRDRELLKRTAFERRISGLEAERAAAAKREAATAEAAAQKALEDEAREVGNKMIAVFGDDALDRQIEVLEDARTLIEKVNANRGRQRAGGRVANVDLPIEVRLAMTLQLRDPRTGGVVWDFNNGDMRPKTGRKAA